MDKAVVFYSATGNSALAAKALADKLGAKLIELKEKKQRNLSKIGPAFMAAGFQASVGIHTKLQGRPWEEAESCGELRVVVPVWASRQAPAVNTFLAKCDLKGKKVYLYTVQANESDTAVRARDGMAAKIRGKGGEVAGSYGLTGGAGPGQEPKQELAQKICDL